MSNKPGKLEFRSDIIAIPDGSKFIHVGRDQSGNLQLRIRGAASNSLGDFTVIEKDAVPGTDVQVDLSIVVNGGTPRDISAKIKPGHETPYRYLLDNAYHVAVTVNDFGVVCLDFETPKPPQWSEAGATEEPKTTDITKEQISASRLASSEIQAEGLLYDPEKNVLRPSASKSMFKRFVMEGVQFSIDNQAKEPRLTWSGGRAYLKFTDSRGDMTAEIKQGSCEVPEHQTLYVYYLYNSHLLVCTTDIDHIFGRPDIMLLATYNSVTGIAVLVGGHTIG